MLQRSLAPNLLELAVKSTYEATEVSKAPVTEVLLRVSAEASRADAEALIQKIRDGGDFAALARTSSCDSSAANGGLMDYQRRDTLAPELAGAGFSMAIGDLTAYPVRSGGLWYVVRCEGRRTRPPLTFAEARAMVERNIVTAGSNGLRGLAIKQTNISY